MFGEHAFKRFYKGTDAQHPGGYWEPKKFNASRRATKRAAGFKSGRRYEPQLGRLAIPHVLASLLLRHLLLFFLLRCHGLLPSSLMILREG